MLSCLPSLLAVNRNAQIGRLQQNELNQSAISEQDSPLPRPVSAPLAQENNGRAQPSSMVMGVCWLGLATSIGLFCLGRSQNKEQDQSSNTLNDLTKFSLFLFVTSVCTASFNACHMARKKV